MPSLTRGAKGPAGKPTSEVRRRVRRRDRGDASLMHHLGRRRGRSFTGPNNRQEPAGEPRFTVSRREHHCRSHPKGLTAEAQRHREGREEVAKAPGGAKRIQSFLLPSFSFSVPLWFYFLRPLKITTCLPISFPPVLNSGDFRRRARYCGHPPTCCFDGEEGSGDGGFIAAVQSGFCARSMLPRSGMAGGK